MKKSQVVGVCLSIILLSTSKFASAQCKGFAKQVDLSVLDQYEFCGEVQTAQMYSGDSAEIRMVLSPKSKYRIVLVTQDYIGEADLRARDRHKKDISIPVVNNGKKYWEVFTAEKEKVDLSIHIQPAQSKKATHGIVASGCVVLAVGKISLEELVELSSGSIDL